MYEPAGGKVFSGGGKHVHHQRRLGRTIRRLVDVAVAREPDPERRSHSRSALHVDGPVMRIDDRLHDRQPQTRSSAAASAISLTPREPLEHLRQIIGRDAVTVIGHLEDEGSGIGGRG